MTHSYERFGPAKLQRPAADLGLIPQFKPAGAKRFSDVYAILRAMRSRHSGDIIAPAVLPPASGQSRSCGLPDTCELRDTQLQERFAGLLSEFVADKLPMPK